MFKGNAPGHRRIDAPGAAIRSLSDKGGGGMSGRPNPYSTRRAEHEGKRSGDDDRDHHGDDQKDARAEREVPREDAHAASAPMTSPIVVTRSGRAAES